MWVRHSAVVLPVRSSGPGVRLRSCPGLPRYWLSCFFANSLLLAYLASNRPVTESVISQDVVIEDMIDVPSASARDEDLSEPLLPGEEAGLPVSSLPGEESDLPELPDTYDSGTVDSDLPETDFPGN